jgi:GNAT superfamily N-acetyltransferase
MPKDVDAPPADDVGMTAETESYVTRLLTPDTWEDFAALVEANNGVWGGCWCIGMHPEGLPKGTTAERNKALKRDHVVNRTAHQVLVYDQDQCVGWCQFGSPAELPNIKNPRTYAKDLVALPAWRIGCIFTGSRHRNRGVARAAVAAVLEEIKAAGGGVVEAYPEQAEGRPPQRGAYFHTGPESLFAEFGFVRDRRIAKWRWVMRREVSAGS